MASTLECKRSSVPGRNPKSTASSVEASSELGRRQHRLDEMERAFLRDDPKFAANVSIGHVRRRRRVVGDGAFLLGTVVLLAGLVDTAESTLTGVLISTAGLLMMAAAAATLLFRPRRH